MRAYHFSNMNGKTRYTNEPIVIGQRLEARDPLLLCINGLHASKRIIDALEYAPGCLLHIVELEGGILESQDKCCARYRTALTTVDFTKALKRFTQWCAERTERYAVSAENNVKHAVYANVPNKLLFAAKTASDTITFTKYVTDTMCHDVRDMSASARLAAGCARDAAKQSVISLIFAHDTRGILDDHDITERGDLASQEEKRLQEDKLQEALANALKEGA